MADTIKSAVVAKIKTNYEDGDYRLITLNDPKENLTLEQVQTAMNLGASVLISDKSGAKYTGTSEAKYVNTTRTYFDLS